MKKYMYIVAFSVFAMTISNAAEASPAYYKSTAKPLVGAAIYISGLPSIIYAKPKLKYAKAKRVYKKNHYTRNDKKQRILLSNAELYNARRGYSRY